MFNYKEIDIVPTLLYCILLTISIIPFYKFRSDKIRLITLNNKKIFITVSWVLIVLTFISLGIIIPNIKNTLALNLADVRSEFYQDTGTFYEFSGLPWYQYLINFAPSFSPILLLFFFYSVVYMDNKKIFNILLLLSSIVLSLNSILNAARTQVIYWFMTFCALYVCFRPQFKAKSKVKILVPFIIIGIFGIIYIFSVSTSRFEDRESGTLGSLISYSGQSFLQFCSVYDHYTFDKLTFDRVFPITSKYILGHKFTTTQFRDQQSLRIGANTAVFFTFLGDAMLDFGKFGMIIYTLIFYFISIKYLKRKDYSSISLSQMIIFVLLMRQSLLGLFAYVYTSISSSIMIIGSLFIALLLNKKIKI
jgi:oligosaccharide repeat unit polymerase